MKFFKNIRKSRSKSDEIFCAQLKNILGFKPKNIAVYKEAFTHRSSQLKSENGLVINFERLEYLGDAILGSIIADYLYNKVPNANEGYLTQMRSKIVSRNHLNDLGENLNLINNLTSKTSKSKLGSNIHGNLFEALIGAVYLDKGFDYCKSFIEKKVISVYVDLEKLEGKITSYKGLLIEWTQKNKKKINFEVFEDTGNQNIKHFSVKLSIDKKLISKGRATSKKKAEEMAAKRGYYVLQSQIQK